MSKNVEFHSYSVNVKTALKDKAIAFLHEIGGEIRSQAQRNSRRKTSQTAGSYQYKVDEDALAVHIIGMQSMKNLEQVNMQSMVVAEKVIGSLLTQVENHKHQKVERHTPRKKQKELLLL